MGEEAAYPGLSPMALYWFLGFVIVWSGVMVGVIKFFLIRALVDRDTKLEEIAEEVGKHGELHTDHSRRLIEVEQSIKHAPNHEDIKNLHRRLDDVSGKIERQTGVLTVIRDLIQKEHSE